MKKFKRQDWYKKKKLELKWKKPKGRHSKRRLHRKSRGPLPGIGYRSPKTSRGLGPGGYMEVRVSNLNDVEKINPKEQAAVIAKTVGKKKRAEIIKKAEELGVKISNVKSL